MFLLPGLSALTVVLSAVGYGRPLVPSEAEERERTVLSFLLGIPVLLVGAVVAGALGLYSLLLLFFLLGPGILITIGSFSFLRQRIVPLSRKEVGLSLLLALLLLPLGLVSFAPLANHDAMTAHAYLPDIWAQAKRITTTPWSFVATNFQGLHALLVLPLLMGPPEGMLVLHGLLGLAGILATSLLSRRVGGDRASALIAALLAATPTGVIFLFHNLQADIPPSALIMGYLCLAHLYAERGKGLVAAALLFGAAVSMKVTALVWLPILPLAGLRILGLRGAFRALTLALAAAFLFSLPWFIRNYLSTGNPIFPFFSGQTDFWEATAVIPNSVDKVTTALGSLLGLGTTGAFIGLFFLAVIPGAFLAWPNLRAPARGILIYSTFVLVGGAILTGTAHFSLIRFFLPAFWALTAISAAGLASRRWGIILGLVVAAGNGSYGWLHADLLIGADRVVLGLASREAYERRHDPGRAIRFAARDSAVFALSYYAYGLGPRAVAPVAYNGAIVEPFFKDANGETLAVRLKKSGFTHLLCDFDQMKRHFADAPGFESCDPSSQPLQDVVESWPLVESRLVRTREGSLSGSALWTIP